jgi:hypothetical protein
MLHGRKTFVTAYVIKPCCFTGQNMMQPKEKPDAPILIRNDGEQIRLLALSPWLPLILLFRSTENSTADSSWVVVV